MTVLAVVLAVVAAALCVHPPRSVSLLRIAQRDGSGGELRDSRSRGGRLVVACTAAVATGLLIWADGTVLALCLILLVTSLGVSRLLLMSRRRAAAVGRERRVLEVCEVLTSELRAGQPPVTALASCVETWGAFRPVAAAARLGADVPAALRRLGLVPGAEGLLAVADAWQVSQASGAALSSALSQVSETVREHQATRRLISSELASAQATARLVAVLPLVALGLGSGLGGDPWGFLLATPAGLGCLGIGGGLALLGLWWIERIADGALRT